MMEQRTRGTLSRSLSSPVLAGNGDKGKIDG
jgi:hypothetical protein